MDTFANMDTTVDKNTPYNRRPWIFTALSLRFNEALTYREIAEQLNISASAIHKMFTRFRRTGINWPLSEEYSPEAYRKTVCHRSGDTWQPGGRASGGTKRATVPLMQSLYEWIQGQMKVLSRHSDTAKAFAYLLKQWDALNLYCRNGWAEIDNNIAENALRGVALGRKNWLFAGSDAGGEQAAVLYSLIGTCRLNGVEPETWLRYVLGHIQDWPVNRLRDLLPWKVDLASAVLAQS